MQPRLANDNYHLHLAKRWDVAMIAPARITFILQLWSKWCSFSGRSTDCQSSIEWHTRWRHWRSRRCPPQCEHIWMTWSRQLFQFVLVGLFRSLLRTLATHYHPTLDPAVLWTPSNDTSRPICSDSLNLMPPAPLYFRTLWRNYAIQILLLLSLLLFVEHLVSPLPRDDTPCSLM